MVPSQNYCKEKLYLHFKIIILKMYPRHRPDIYSFFFLSYFRSISYRARLLEVCFVNGWGGPGYKIGYIAFNMESLETFLFRYSFSFVAFEMSIGFNRINVFSVLRLLLLCLKTLTHSPPSPSYKVKNYSSPKNWSVFKNCNPVKNHRFTRT